MKKKILGGFVILVIAAVAAINVNFNNSSNKNNLSDVSLANVEALAQNGNAGIDCYRTISSSDLNAMT